MLRQERPPFSGMLAGSILGAALGSLLLGLVLTRLLVGVLGVILLGSAVKTFRTPIEHGMCLAQGLPLPQ